MVIEVPDNIKWKDVDFKKLDWDKYYDGEEYVVWKDNNDSEELYSQSFWRSVK